MCVGDRGLCNGSKIEGFLKYGGNWKLNKSSLYTAVCITNEHNTSQTACFASKSFSIPTVWYKEKQYS
ncbi:hypothetical protein BCV71DRAFT_176395 [Rhizopus microsporus]|uniref:Uncharacterized protein n=1 Tax=Rhizopus microsporus TaxID=58291 RepID=A0A1X0S7G4_RHIZD|nr:hypothetical protein BCV71DRAFT_176395 [Rhizopus microsporus]